MNAMYQALVLTDVERELNSEGLIKHIRHRDISNWLCDQLSDISDLIGTG